MFERLLIANRGEIAVRIIRACRELGIETVAVYSEADAEALHVMLADRAVRLGPAQASASYLAIPRLIDAAHRTGAQAIHPGYGFLSENAAFAHACADAGLTFVGPPADAIERLGSKIEARRLAARAGVPVVPGDTPGEQDDAAIAAAIERVGLPVLVKPSGGGGGIGMRIVREPGEIADEVRGARRDALGAFGDPTLYVERLVERPRHVEIQVLADADGHVIHLFERECSLQRRHQKVIEESPSVALTPRLRERMGAAAVAVTRAAGYRNAGTVEFLLDGTGDDAAFYFLEMNTRLQVEHPVTEAVTGLDLVHAQLRIAAGEPLAWAQEDLTLRGHALECRVYAEDPARDFLPQAGPLLLYREPRGPGIRVDAGVVEGDSVSVHYDPLLAKLVVQGDSRPVVTRRAAAALREFAVLGIPTNVSYLLEILQHPAFEAGELDTGFLDRETPGLLVRITSREPEDEAVAAAAAFHASAGRATPARGAPETHVAMDPWETLRGWRTA
jgi:acetyl-CoA/propionyl-CoA carboxylase, biotin carboxylase, biotin carboxyl carrier protein